MMKRGASVVFVAGVVITSGCSTLQGLLSDKPAPVAKAPAAPTPTRFSENNDVGPGADRSYKRMTRQRMEEESQLQSNAGSMWVMEGQSAYLFAQNKTRREGDLLNIKLEGAAQKQVETKVSVIRKLLKQLEDEEKRAKELQEQQLLQQQQQQTGGSGLAATTPPPAAATPPARAPASEEKKEKEDEIKIESVPTRIVERQPDGNYRIKGQSPFMIGNKEYKVIVTGIVRPEDYNDEGVSSNKILDPQYDVVSLRRKE